MFNALYKCRRLNRWQFLSKQGLLGRLRRDVTWFCFLFFLITFAAVDIDKLNFTINLKSIEKVGAFKSLNYKLKGPGVSISIC